MSTTFRGNTWRAQSLTSPPDYAQAVAKPYRWRGIPGWNPAAEAARKHQADVATGCPQCGAPAGQNCQTSGGRIYQDYEPCHSARRRAS